MTDYVHGETDAREVARLEKQALLTAEMTLHRFDAAPGMRVLNLGTGVGAMAECLAARFPGIEIVGLDLRESQLAVARRRHPVAEYVQGDARAMPFGDATFDRVHASWLLEHVVNPASVLAEVRRVLKPGGYCHFVEVDNATFVTEPPIAEVIAVMNAMNRAQQAAGGDPFVGSRLGALLAGARFSAARTWVTKMGADAATPILLQRFVEEFAEIFEGLDESLGEVMRDPITIAAARLRQLPSIAGAAICNHPVIGQGTR